MSICVGAFGISYLALIEGIDSLFNGSGNIINHFDPRGLKGFAKQMQASGFDARPLFFRPAVNMWAWASGQTWETIIKAGGMAEGDLAMLVLRTADHLRHIKSLDRIFASMSSSARQAIELILRDPVMPDREPESDEQPTKDVSG